MGLTKILPEQLQLLGSIQLSINLFPESKNLREVLPYLIF